MRANGRSGAARAAREGEDAGPPRVVLVVAGLSLVLALALALLALLPPVAHRLVVAPAYGVAVTLVVHAVVATGLVAGAAGLLLRAAPGWWAAALSAAANALYQAKLLAFYVRAIRWSHPDAAALGIELALRYGLPIAASLALCALLFLPSIRVRFGLRQTPHRRRRR